VLWLIGSFPLYLRPFVEDATDEAEDVDEFEGRGILKLKK